MKKCDMLKHFEEFMESLSDDEFFDVFEKEFGAVYEEIPQLEGEYNVDDTLVSKEGEIEISRPMFTIEVLKSNDMGCQKMHFNRSAKTFTESVVDERKKLSNKFNEGEYSIHMSDNTDPKAA